MFFDAGVFIALENSGKRRVIVALVERLLEAGTPPQTTEPVLAQAWRDPAKQVAMTRLAAATIVHPFSDARTVGLRCATTETSDVVDADLAVRADTLNQAVLTTDPTDMSQLGARYVAL